VLVRLGGGCGGVAGGRVLETVDCPVIGRGPYTDRVKAAELYPRCRWT